LLGKSPLENTYLYRPISNKFSDGLRGEIAAAVARNTVQGLSKRPRTAAAPMLPVAVGNVAQAETVLGTCLFYGPLIGLTATACHTA